MIIIDLVARGCATDRAELVPYRSVPVVHRPPDVEQQMATVMAACGSERDTDLGRKASCGGFSLYASYALHSVEKYFRAEREVLGHQLRAFKPALGEQ